MNSTTRFVFLFCVIVLRTVISDGFHAPHGLIEIANFDPANNTIYVDETDRKLLVRIIRRGGCKYPAKVQAKCVDGTAKKDFDYQCRSQIFAWEDEDCSERLFYVWINDDTKYELDETFLFSIISDGDTAVGFDRLQIIIPANDEHRGIIRIHPNPYTAIEGELVKLEITREEGNIGPAKACYNIWPLTAMIDFDIVKPENDFECVTWKHEENHNHTVSIQTVSDNLFEADEIFYVVLQNVENAELDSNPDNRNATVIIQANNLNELASASTSVPCDKPEIITVDPIGMTDSRLVVKGFTVQFLPKLPFNSTVKHIYLLATSFTKKRETIIQGITFNISAIYFDDDNFQVGCKYDPPPYSIVNETVLTWQCGNKHTDTIIDNHRKQTIETSINTIEFGNTFLSPDMGYVFEPLKQYPWDIESILTFHITIEDCLLNTTRNTGNTDNKNNIQYQTMSDIQEQMQQNNGQLSEQFRKSLLTQWEFRIVTDAYPCIETNWSQWTLCNQSLKTPPVGTGIQWRHCIQAVGEPGLPYKCGLLRQSQHCTVSFDDKQVSFSTNKVTVQEGGIGSEITVRLLSMLNTTINKTTLDVERLRLLRGYDAIVYFSVPQFNQKELAIDPKYIGWYKDSWDKIFTLKITAIDDASIDALQQFIDVTVTMKSLDPDYNEIALPQIKVTVIDNEKCKYCGVATADDFQPLPSPSFWDWKSITALSIFLSWFVGSIVWQIHQWRKGDAPMYVILSVYVFSTCQCNCFDDAFCFDVQSDRDELREEMLFDGLIEDNEKRESELIEKAKSLAKFKEQQNQDTKGN